MYLIRHGHTNYGEYTHNTWFDITEKGINQGIEVAGALVGKIERVVTSKQRRAMAFGRVIADRLGVALSTNPLFNSFVGHNQGGYLNKIDEIEGNGQSLMRMYEIGELDDMDGVFVPRAQLRSRQNLVFYDDKTAIVTHGEVIKEWTGKHIARGGFIEITSQLDCPTSMQKYCKENGCQGYCDGSIY